MTAGLVLSLAFLTYLSRAAALVLLPRLPARWEAFLSRVPAPLFAGFAASSLLTASRHPAPAETLAAVLVAVAVATRIRSLLAILAAGLGGYLLVTGIRMVM